jgi:hypothetical protein
MNRNLHIEVTDPATKVVLFTADLEIPSDLFVPPNSDAITIEGVKTAIDWVVFEKEHSA